MKAPNILLAIFRAALAAALFFSGAVQLEAQRRPLPANESPSARYEIGRKAGQIASVSVPLVALGGVAALDADSGLKNLRDSWIPDFRNRADDYLQYSPGLLMLSLKALGVQGRSCSWGEMLTASAAAYVFMGVSVNALKYTTSVSRPDGVDNHSFPSGHSATAFMMAGLLTREYGELSPWVGVGAYSLASAVGAMRIANNKHWLSDVMTGAGLGVLSAEAGYLLSDILFNEGLCCECLSDDETPSFLGLYTGTGRLYGESAALRSAAAGIEGAHFLSPLFGLGGRALVCNAGDRGAAAGGSDCDFASFAAGAYFSLPICKRISLGSKALMGYFTQTDDTPASSFSPGCGLDLGTGLSADIRLRDHYGLRLFADYDLLASSSLLTLGFSINALW